MQQQQPPNVFCKTGVLKSLAKFKRKYLCQSLFFNKVAGLRVATLLKKRLWHWCFPMNFVNFLRTPFLIEHLRWLFLIQPFKKTQHNFFSPLKLNSSYIWSKRLPNICLCFIPLSETYLNSSLQKVEKCAQFVQN